MGESKNLWVWIETNPDNTPKNVGLELLNPGKKLAAELGGKLVAVVIAEDAGIAAKAAGNYGADLVIAVEGPEYKEFSNDAYSAALSHLIEKYGPDTFLIGATANGRSIGPRIVGRTKARLIADCKQIGIDEETGGIAWTRQSFGGTLMSVVVCKDHKPQMGAVRPGVFKKSEFDERDVEIVKESFSFDPKDIRTRVVEVLAEVSENVDLEGADIIVTGGRGVGGSEGFDVIRSFAKSLGAVVGSSRAAVQEGWIPHAHQVGQSGKSVSPRVYIACGVSGAVQHVAGMKSSETIIAINSDPDAMIFSVADYGIVGDLFKVLPILEEELKNKLNA